MLPVPPELQQPLAVSCLLLSLLGVFYFRRYSLKTRVFFVLLVFILVCSAYFAWAVYSHVEIGMDAGEYSYGEMVQFLVKPVGHTYSGEKYFKMIPLGDTIVAGASIQAYDGINWAPVSGLVCIPDYSGRGWVKTEEIFCSWEATGRGRYRASFCYWRAYDLIWGESGAQLREGAVPVCAEKEFTVD